MAKKIKISSYIFPIGYIIEVDNTEFDPNTFYINGVWERIKGKVIVGVDENDADFNTTAKNGGSKYTERHSHKQQGSTVSNSSSNLKVQMIYANSLNTTDTGTTVGSDYGTESFGTGNSGNLQPYYTAYIWKLVSYN